MTETIVLSCGGVKNSDAETEYSAYWRTTFFEDNTLSTELDTYEENNEVSNITKCHYTDDSGKIITKISTQNKIILNIFSQGMIGKSVNIDLSDINHDFVYNGEKLKNDILEGYVIESNKDEVKFLVIFNPKENTI